MAISILRNVKLFIAGYERSGDVNEVSLSNEAAILDRTTFENGGVQPTSRKKLPGLKNWSFDLKGFYQATLAAGSVDEQLFAAIAAAESVASLLTDVPADSVRAYFGQALAASYTPGGKIGEILPIGAKAEGSGDLVGGFVAKPTAAVTANGNGTALSLGAVSATQKVFAACHLLAISGTAVPTITARVESDNAAGFPHAATVLTLPAQTAIGGVFGCAAGPITDTYFRLAWTVSGTTPSFTILGLIGIQ